MSATTFVYIIEIVGTFAFAISGIRLASAKRFDWFGAYVVGLATAIGGGTLRDLLLNLTPFWMTNSMYIIVTGIALLIVILFGKYLIKLHNTIFIFDTIGLGLFVVVGIQKSLMIDYPFWVAIIMGVITGAAGGVLRDIFINEEPLIFRKDIYALACVVGGIAYYISEKLGANYVVSQISCATFVIATRIIAVKYHLCLPVLKGEEDYSNNKPQK
jgi:Predicted membrane protein